MNKPKRPPIIRIDLHAETPAYIQIMLKIQELILAGEIHAEEQLPTVRQLAAELAINFNTVARAYRLLDRAGLISTQQGRGTFVLESAAGQDKLRQEVLKEMTEQFMAETARLDFSPGEVEAALREHLQFDLDK